MGKRGERKWWWRLFEKYGMTYNKFSYPQFENGTITKLIEE